MTSPFKLRELIKKQNDHQNQLEETVNKQKEYNPYEQESKDNID